MARTTFALFFILIFLVLIVLLQVWLSKREGKWPGRILPITSFLISFIYPLNMAIPSVGIASISARRRSVSTYPQL